MILIDDTEASLEFFNSTEHYFRLIFARSVFLPDLLDKFILQKNDRFRCNVFYESESKYQIIKSCEERCMKFVVIDFLNKEYWWSCGLYDGTYNYLSLQEIIDYDEHLYKTRNR